jgi:hypothetical protein
MRSSFRRRSKLPATQISKRIDAATSQFLSDFTKTGGFNHSVSKGSQREQPIVKFFHELLPRRFSVTSGEIFDSFANISSQTDLIIYRTIDGIPVLDSDPTMLQSESVMCVCEVKSKISTKEYKDCLKKAKNLHELRPFGNKLRIAASGSEPGNEECRYFISIFAYSSDSVGTLEDECIRFIKCAEDLKIDSKIIDRIYILGKGVINPKELMFAEDTVDRKIGLFYFYVSHLQFAIREARRRSEVPYLEYFGKMSEGWKKCKKVLFVRVKP